MCAYVKQGFELENVRPEALDERVCHILACRLGTDSLNPLCAHSCETSLNLSPSPARAP